MLPNLYIKITLNYIQTIFSPPLQLTSHDSWYQKTTLQKRELVTTKVLTNISKKSHRHNFVSACNTNINISNNEKVNEIN